MFDRITPLRAPLVSVAMAAVVLAGAAACSSSSPGAGTGGGKSSSSSGGVTGGASSGDEFGGSSGVSGTGGSGGGPGAGGAGSVGSGGAAMCNVPNYGGMETKFTVTALDATISDPSGAPIQGLETFLCGIDICPNPINTDAAGHVHYPSEMETAPAFKFGDGYTYAKFAIPITVASPNLDKLVTAPLPAAGVAFETGKPIVSSDVTLTLPVGDTVIVDMLAFAMPDQQLFRAVTLPLDKLLSTIDMSQNLVEVFGVGPVGTTFCPAAKVTVPNITGLAAGSAVEFVIHGVDVSENWALYGGWMKVSDGAVSADGKTISTSATGGLPLLTVFGVRAKP